MIKYIYISLIIFGLSLLLSSCSSFNRYDDAVRIKSDSAYKYIQNPVTKELRQGSTLRGTVLKVNVVSVPNSCPVTDTTGFTSDTTILFLDKDLDPKPENYEKVPIEDIVLISDVVDLEPNEYNNINLFENFNDPQRLRNVREVPVNSIIIDTCCVCSCIPWDYDLNFNINLNCPKRDFFWWFIAPRAGYAVYMDLSNLSTEVARTSYMFELTSGVRFGGKKEWAVGLTYSTGIKAFDSFKAEDVLRPVVLLYGRYQSPSESFLGQCIRPYIFGEFGMTIDELSIALPRFQLSESCRNCRKFIEGLKADGLLPEVDLGLPISFSIGAGIDIPFSKYFDLSFDIAFRSLGVGESVEAVGFENIPSLRRINMMIVRMGFTI